MELENGYKRTEVGVIPKDWEVKILLEVAQFENGKAHENFISEDGKYIVVNSKFVSTKGKVRKFSNQNLSPLSIGDIAMVMSDIPNGKALAKCFLVNKDEIYTLNQRICSLKSINTNNEFLFYVIDRNKYFLQFDSGVGQTNLRKDEVLECPLVIPPLGEQKKIAEILSTWDKSIETTEKLITAKQKLKKSLMQRLLTGKQRFPEFQGQEWRKKELQQFVELIKDKYEPKNNQSVPCVELEHVSQGTGKLLGFDESKTKESLKTKFKEGDVLFGKLRPYLRKFILADFEGVCTSEIWVLRVKKNLCNSEYLFYTVQSDNFIQSANATSGSKMPRSDWNWISEFPFSLPSLEEQKKIAAVLNACDAEINVLQSKLGALRQQKRGLMQKLLTGRVRVKTAEEN